MNLCLLCSIVGRYIPTIPHGTVLPLVFSGDPNMSFGQKRMLDKM